MSTQAQAQTVTQIQPLSFGTFATSNNNGNYTITVNPGNGSVYDPRIIAETQAQRGEYLLQGQDPNRALDITVTNGSMTLNDFGVGDTISITNYTNNSPSTDGAGDATIYIGATLTTNGSGTQYPSGSYADNIDITVNYQ